MAIIGLKYPNRANFSAVTRIVVVVDRHSAPLPPVERQKMALITNMQKSWNVVFLGK